MSNPTPAAAPVEPPPVGPPPAVGPQPSRPRRWRAGLSVALLCTLLGFALVAQVRSNESSSALTGARQEDLVRILDDLSSREDRIRSEIADLQQTQRSLAAGSGSGPALAAARQRATELGVLAGTLAAHGPGVVVTVHQGSQHVGAEVLLDALEEMRGAGAEAVQVRGAGGAPVRVAAATYFVDAGEGVQVEGIPLQPPYVFTVIGDARTISTALSIPGGVVDTVRQAGGSTEIDDRADVQVSALRTVRRPQYARPVS
jgi:uncharacterized protein YlxW (UPF0749 family)